MSAAFADEDDILLPETSRAKLKGVFSWLIANLASSQL